MKFCHSPDRSRRGAVLGLLVLASGACQREPQPAAPPSRPPMFRGDELPKLDTQVLPKKGGILRVALDAEPPSLNPQLDPLDGWSKQVGELIYESLARPNPTTWQHEPRLAERWDTGDDHRTFTFHLRRNVRWHDGKPFSADDVIFTFDKLLDPSSKTASIKSFLEPIATYEKVDDFTVRFTLERAYWFAFDAIAEVLIYPKHLYAQGDFNTHPRNRAPIGTGKFVFDSWKTGDRIILRRNDAYFGTPAPLEGIHWLYAPDPTVRLQLAKRGDIDVVLRLTPEAWKGLADDADLGARYWRIRHVPSGLWFIGWNMKRPMFSDVRVRRALTMLIDRRDIVDNLRLGLDEPAASWFYPGSPEFNAALEPVPHDPKAARALLEEAGYSDANGDGILDKNGEKLAFTFLYPAGNPFYEQLASMLVGELGRAGIAVESLRLDWAVYTERLRRHEFDACSLLWQLYPRSDPYQIWHSGEAKGGSNFVNFASPEVDGLLERARATFDDGERTALYHRLSDILHREQPYTMLFYRYNLSLVSRRFGGIESTPYGIFRIDALHELPAPNGAVP